LINPSIIIPGSILYIPYKTITNPPENIPPQTPPSVAAVTTTPSGNQQNQVEQILKPVVTPIPTISATIVPTVSPRPTPKPIGPPEEMKVSVNISKCDTRVILQALAMSMDKKVIMLKNPSQKDLNFNITETPLLELINLLLNNENASLRFIGNTIVIES
jgi:hypothetical protein